MDTDKIRYPYPTPDDMNSINTDMETVDIEVDTEMETVDMFRNDPAHFVKLKHITPEIRSLILELGPWQPLSNDLPGKIFPKNGSKDNRSFKEIYYYQILPDKTKCLRDWLSYSPSKNKIYRMHFAMNRQVINEIIDIVLYLARHNLAFRGKIFFVTCERQNQLIDSISHDISSQIQQAIVQSNVFSISIDSTFDASRREQVSFVIRYVDDKFELIHERVIAIKESPITTRKDLYNLFSYDGASNMRGNYKGLQAHIKRECPQTLYVWCHAHRLALVVKQAVSCDSNSRDLFGNLESLYVLLWCSKKRAATFREAQKKHLDLKYTQQHAVKRVFPSCSFTNIGKTENLEGVTDATAGANCSGLIDYFTSRRFLLTAFTFKKLFDVLEVVTRQFQTHDIDILLATTIVTKIINSIRKLRANNSFEEIIKLTDNFINESDTDFIPLQNIRPRRVPIKAGELMQDDLIVCPTKKFESDRFETTNIGLLKDIALLSYRRIQEKLSEPTMLPKDSFIDNNNSSDDEDENDNNDDNISMLELNTYDDLNETWNKQRAIKNIGTSRCSVRAERVCSAHSVLAGGGVQCH
ncbi:hypothetical protein QTP88_022419 [Uroleucon formosanum]